MCIGEYRNVPQVERTDLIITGYHKGPTITTKDIARMAYALNIQIDESLCMTIYSFCVRAVPLMSIWGGGSP